VVLNARRVDRLKAVAKALHDGGHEAVAVAGDITRAATIRRMVQTALKAFGRLDILVNNAGGSPHALAFKEVPEWAWQRTLASNLKSAFFCSQAVVPIMQKQGCGQIINVASFAGRQRSQLSGADYASAKAGLIGLTRHLAWELGPLGIRVNAVAPGVTLTNRVRAMWQKRTRAYQQGVLAGIPLGRLAEPIDVARAIAFLASAESSYITGATLDVNGGSFMN
jgi:NAD(P)-dependent dehydrogenase (short-subunit alcohol dehydrogenase family)